MTQRYENILKSQRIVGELPGGRMNGQESEPGSSGEDSGLMKSAALKIEPKSSGLRQRSCPMNTSQMEGVRAVPPVSSGDSRSDQGENREGQLPFFLGCAFFAYRSLSLISSFNLFGKYNKYYTLYIGLFSIFA